MAEYENLNKMCQWEPDEEEIPVVEEKPQEEVQEVKQETSVENKEPSVPTFTEQTEQTENTPIKEENPKEENLQNDSSFLNEINDSFETDFGSVAELKEAINELISQEDSESEIQYAALLQ